MEITSSQNPNTSQLTDQLQKPPKIIMGTTKSVRWEGGSYSPIPNSSLDFAFLDPVDRDE